MAQTVVVLLVDDLDGGQADETVSFALDGKAYEIDLGLANAVKLRERLACYVTAARRAGTDRRSRGPVPSATRPHLSVDREQNQAIREWARNRGMKVSGRGRIPSDILVAYNSR